MKSHVLRKPSGGSRKRMVVEQTLVGRFQATRESLLLDGEKSPNNSAIFDLTEINNGESRLDNEWENNDYDSQKLSQGDENLDQDLNEL